MAHDEPWKLALGTDSGPQLKKPTVSPYPPKHVHGTGRRTAEAQRNKKMIPLPLSLSKKKIYENNEREEVGSSPSRSRVQPRPRLLVAQSGDLSDRRPSSSAHQGKVILLLLLSI